MKRLLILTALLTISSIAQAGICGRIAKGIPYSTNNRINQELHYLLINQDNEAVYLSFGPNIYENNDALYAANPVPKILQPVFDYVSELFETQEVVYVEKEANPIHKDSRDFENSDGFAAISYGKEFVRVDSNVNYFENRIRVASIVSGRGICK